MLFRFLSLLLVSVVVLPLAMNGQVTAQQASSMPGPRIHLITLHDQTDQEWAGSYNANIGKITTLFLNNVPNSELTITHIVKGPNSRPKSCPTHSSGIRRLTRGECSQGNCEFFIAYHDNSFFPSEFHLTEKPLVKNFSGTRNSDLVKNALRSALNEIKVNTNDTVVFYYTGHGEKEIISGNLMYGFKAPLARNNAGNTRLQPDKLRSLDVRRTIETKNPRLLVIWSDCCSGYVGTDLGLEERVVPRVRESVSDTCLNGANFFGIDPAFDNLFFKVSGVVEVVASEPGKNAVLYESYGHNNRRERVYFDVGSVFTTAICETFYADIRNWHDFRTQLTQCAKDHYQEKLREKESRTSPLGTTNREDNIGDHAPYFPDGLNGLK